MAGLRRRFRSGRPYQIVQPIWNETLDMQIFIPTFIYDSLNKIMSTPTVFIVDDDQAAHVRISKLMKTVKLPTESYYQARDFLKDYQQQPGCLLLDMYMPEMTGLELYEQLPAKNISLPVIFLTSHTNVPTELRVRKANMFDYLEKQVDNLVLLKRVQQAIKFDTRSRKEEAERQKWLARFKTLTPREHEVMEQLLVGKSNKSAAIDLGIHYKTVENYHTQIMRKMQTRNTVQLVHVAFFCRLLSPSEELIFGSSYFDELCS